MKKIPPEIIQFFGEQGCIIISTVDAKGRPHSSCKGIVKISAQGRIYLLDLYRAATYRNIRKNPKVSITAFDEHRFKGYCLKGKAKIAPIEKLKSDILKAWEDKIASRITQRVIRNIRQDKGESRHPEAFLPNPDYMIVVEVGEIVDLTPPHLREGV